ncbi:hypothetical protein V6N11_071817 [Hibiscus sabdariffa]|uniref:Uncharacterized protein n=1 Tax=Hibiscus sabdariffa TaxID=183260 RepID=A0ABR2U1T6_9ROSI
MSLCFAFERFLMARARGSPKEGAVERRSAQIVRLGRSMGKPLSLLFQGSVSFLKGCVDCLVLCYCEIVPPFARKMVSLVLWISDWKGKIDFQEGEVLDDGTLPGLDAGYYPSFLPCLSDKSARAIFTKLTYKMDGTEFFSLAKRWCSFYAHGLKNGAKFFSLAKRRKIIEAIIGGIIESRTFDVVFSDLEEIKADDPAKAFGLVAATLDVVVSRSSVSPVLMFATLGL